MGALVPAHDNRRFLNGMLYVRRRNPSVAHLCQQGLDTVTGG